MRTYAQAKYNEPLITDYQECGITGLSLPREEFKTPEELFPKELLRETPPDLPQLSEPQCSRHFTRLSQMNYGVESGIYPLGSCTMKYNPKVNELIAGDTKIAHMHPLQHQGSMQGSLEILHQLQEALAEIGGIDAVTLQPAAGAHGEFTGLLIIRAYHSKAGQSERNEIVLPDSAHGTNPASAAMAGFKVVEIKSNEDGTVDLDALKAAVGPKTAGFMLTNPNTLGIFEDQVEDIASIVHNSGGLLYYDGANLNAIMGKTRPGDMGFDIIHFNLHKTFATPHGGGGPGAGPIGVKKKLEEFLPVPRVVLTQKENGNKEYTLEYNAPDSIGRVHAFFGNFAVLVRALTYIKVLGGDGLKLASELAVLNANYMKEKLLEKYPMPFKRLRKHEFVLSGDCLASKGLKTMDIAKRLIDQGIHAPTIYFPLLVHEALMVEPTETESKGEMDRFIEAMLRMMDEDPEILSRAPVNTVAGRVNDVWANKNLILNHKDFAKIREDI